MEQIVMDSIALALIVTLLAAVVVTVKDIIHIRPKCVVVSLAVYILI